MDSGVSLNPKLEESQRSVMERKVERVWLDIETSGLQLGTDLIFEIGLATTDRWGNWINGRDWLVGNLNPEYTRAYGRLTGDKFVGPMHKRSGLAEYWNLQIQRDARGVMDPVAVQSDILVWLAGQGIKHNTMPMCGSSVHFDRARIEYQMPILSVFFTYRNIDVSTLKELCRDLNPLAFQHLSGVKKQELHRVIPDLEDTIDEYQFFIEYFLWCVNS